jgi:predicted alpha/beta superfamily hydrolase
VLIPTEKLAMPGLNRERGLRLYVPPSYADHPERRYPVIYMHDGQNLFDDKTAYSGEWGVDETLNELAKKTGFEAIVVGIDNGAEKRMSELNPYPGPKLKEAEGPDYMRFIVEVVKPYIDQRYRTLPDREHTAILGSSMGGLISHYALQAYPQTFSKYGVFSPSYWASPELVARAGKTPLPADTRVYLYAGGEEGAGMAADAEAMAATLSHQGPPEAVTLHINPKANHNEKYWRPEFGPAVKWLFQIKDKDSQALSH